MFRWLITSIACLAAVQAALTPAPELGQQLTQASFNETVSSGGVWLVEYFFPSCSHCRRFAPTWEQLLIDKKPLTRLAGFHMAQVNCLVQGDLCVDNGITGYPQINLYVDGKFEEEYKDDRGYPILSQWIDDKATKYAQEAVLGLEATEEGRATKLPNPEGKVVEVNEEALDMYKADGPVLVDFFAPWCSHCKSLRPIYDKLAAEMKDQFNIIAVNCDANRALCNRNGISGFPTIRLFNDDKSVDFSGPRTQELMKQFLLKETIKAKMEQIDYGEFSKLPSNSTFFLYLQNFDTTYEELVMVERAIQTLPKDVPVYTANDPVLYKHLNQFLNLGTPPPTSTLVSFSHDEKPVGSLHLPASDASVRRFLATHMFPTIIDLSSDTYTTVMKNEPHGLVVIAAADPAATASRSKLDGIARTWHASVGSKGVSQPVWFALMDGVKWEKWIYGAFGITKEQYPAVVVVDTEKNVFYDMTPEGARPLLVTADIASVLEGIEAKTLTLKIVESTKLRTSVMMIFVAKHPFFTSFVVIVGMTFILYQIVRCVSRDLRPHGGYMNEKGYNDKHARLD